MSRFKGWTSAAIGQEQQKQDKPLPKAKKPGRNHAADLSAALTMLGVKHVTEYRFLHDRRSRFDIAIPEKHICVEFDGGIYSKGRHTRGEGFARDAKKQNLATMNGWHLLRFTTEDTKAKNWEFSAAQMIKDLAEKK